MIRWKRSYEDYSYIIFFYSFIKFNIEKVKYIENLYKIIIIGIIFFFSLSLKVWFILIDNRLKFIRI